MITPSTEQNLRDAMAGNTGLSGTLSPQEIVQMAHDVARTAVSVRDKPGKIEGSTMTAALRNYLRQVVAPWIDATHATQGIIQEGQTTTTWTSFLNPELVKYVSRELDSSLFGSQLVATEV